VAGPLNERSLAARHLIRFRGGESLQYLRGNFGGSRMNRKGDGILPIQTALELMTPDPPLGEDGCHVQ